MVLVAWDRESRIGPARRPLCRHPLRGSALALRSPPEPGNAPQTLGTHGEPGCRDLGSGRQRFPCVLQGFDSWARPACHLTRGSGGVSPPQPYLGAGGEPCWQEVSRWRPNRRPRNGPWMGLASSEAVAYNVMRASEGIPMTCEAEPQVFLCPNCLLPAAEPGPCTRCGRQRVGCRPGDPDDPCRRPLMSLSGRVLTRAPLWWLRHTMGDLANRLRDHYLPKE